MQRNILVTNEKQGTGESSLNIAKQLMHVINE